VNHPQHERLQNYHHHPSLRGGKLFNHDFLTKPAARLMTAYLLSGCTTAAQQLLHNLQVCKIYN
jgi:hypothetical protein